MNKKIISNTTFKNIENNFLKLINTELEEKKLSKLIKEKYSLSGTIKYKKGSITTHKNDIAYKIDYNLYNDCFVSFDSEGEVIDFSLISKKDNQKNKSYDKSLNDIEKLKDEMLKSIADNINIDVVSELLKSKYNFEPNGKIQYKKGNIKVENDKIVYEIELSFNSSLSILLDKKGEIIDSLFKKEEKNTPLSKSSLPQKKEPQKKEIDKMIDDISKIVYPTKAKVKDNKSIKEQEKTKQIQETVLKLAEMIEDINENR